jgi:hypothetical protein
MDYRELIEQFWQQYAAEIKAASHIHDLLMAEGEQIVNDHIALRTFADPRVNISVVEQPFLARGYCEKGQYTFPNKKLTAKHYEHPDQQAPKIFISELCLESFSPWLRQRVDAIIQQIPETLLSDPAQLLLSGVSWQPLLYTDYEQLRESSEYAAWLYAFGFRANHFTINVNQLKGFKSLQSLNDFLEFHGYQLNPAGGKIKGTPAEMLEQSSTIAEKIPVRFQDGDYEIPSCYYEFAKRYPDDNGRLYQGFVAASADKIFESTDVR